MFMFSLLILFKLIYIYLADEQDLIQYTDDNFSISIVEHETALVMFYAPWCGHCKKLKPEFEKAAQELRKNYPPVALIKVDCTDSGKATCNSFGVGGYPTLKIFRNGKMSQDYTGPRDASGMVKYMKLQSGPSSKEFTDLDALESYLNSESAVSVAGFFKNETDLKKAFLQTADKMREKARFVHTSLTNALEKYEVKDDVILFRPVHLRNKFEEESVKYFGNSSVDEISDFIENNYHGLVGHRININRQDFKIPYVIAYYQVDYKRNPKGTNYWRNRILKVAQKFRGRLTFAISHFDDLKEYGDVPFEDKPVVFARDTNNENFKMEEDFSLDSFDNFVRQFLDKKLKQYVKSEAIPETNDAPVKIAVGKNFEDVVIDNGKDTLIVFYSPLCGHCKKLMPTYEMLAEQLINEDVIIAKMDATVNDVPSPFKLGGYPTIYWVPRDSKDSPVPYEGGRKLDDFIKYVAKHATKELKGYDRNGKSKQKIEL